MFEFIKKMLSFTAPVPVKTFAAIPDQPRQMATITKIINCFEQGRPEFQHWKIDNLKDGVFPGSSARQRQVTVSYGLTQTGVIASFLKSYVNLGGKFAKELAPYIPIVPKRSLSNDVYFQSILVKAAKEDKIYTDLLEAFFYEKYINPALKWCKENGIQTWLGKAVVIDSTIHSGSMMLFLRRRFPEHVPANGGDEKTYIKQYLTVRREWLRNHSDSTLKKIWGRPNFYLNEAAKDNWDLDKFPIYPNGVRVAA